MITIGNRSHIGAVDHFFIQTSQARHQLNGRTGLETAAHTPFLIDDAVNTSRLWIHDHNGAGMITKRVHCNPAHFRIFSGGYVLRDKRHCFVTHGGVQSSLSRDRCLTRSLSPASCSFEVATMPAFDAPHFRDAFTLGQGPVQSSLERLERRSLLTCDARSLGSNLSS